MSTLPKVCSVLIGTWIFLGTNLASPAQAFLQQTPPTAPATADKPTEPPAKPHQPRPNPDANGKYHIGDGVTAPRLIFSVEPQFSQKMRKANKSGNCLVAITVDTDGNVKNAHIIKSTPDAKDEEQSDFVLDMQDICINTVQQYRFAPAMYLGKPVPVDLNVEINFQRSAPQS
jgi:outer membrane biosynthesis protein TonB